MHREVRPEEPALAAHRAAQAQPAPDDLAPVALGPSRSVPRGLAAPGKDGGMAESGIGRRHGAIDLSAFPATAAGAGPPPRPPGPRRDSSALRSQRRRFRASVTRDAGRGAFASQSSRLRVVEVRRRRPRLGGASAARDERRASRGRADAGSPRSTGRGSRRPKRTSRPRTPSSAGSLRNSASERSHFSHLSMSGSQRTGAPGRARGTPRCRSPRRGAARGSRSTCKRSRQRELAIRTRPRGSRCSRETRAGSRGGSRAGTSPSTAVQ